MSSSKFENDWSGSFSATAAGICSIGCDLLYGHLLVAGASGTGSCERVNVLSIVVVAVVLLLLSLLYVAELSLLISLCHAPIPPRTPPTGY